MERLLRRSVAAERHVGLDGVSTEPQVLVHLLDGVHHVGDVEERTLELIPRLRSTCGVEY